MATQTGQQLHVGLGAADGVLGEVRIGQADPLEQRVVTNPGPSRARGGSGRLLKGFWPVKRS
jgi:hypothetical protein